MDIQAFWQAVISQDREALADYFCRGATIRRHCSNEQFTAEENIRANCDYPGRWCGEIERLEQFGDCAVLAGRVFPAEETASFHVVSFPRLKDDRILEMDEYWADDGEAPDWRRKTGIGTAIRTRSWEAK